MTMACAALKKIDAEKRVGRFMDWVTCGDINIPNKTIAKNLDRSARYALMTGPFLFTFFDSMFRVTVNASSLWDGVTLALAPVPAVLALASNHNLRKTASAILKPHGARAAKLKKTIRWQLTKVGFLHTAAAAAVVNGGALAMGGIIRSGDLPVIAAGLLGVAVGGVFGAAAINSRRRLMTGLAQLPAPR
jgi:hypothetical protein